MKVSILGSLEVRSGDTEVNLRRGLPRTLFTALLLRSGETISPDALIEILWAEQPPRNPQNALQVLVSYLRKLFEAAGEGGILETRPGGYSLRTDRLEVDAWQFEELVHQAQAFSGTEEDLTVALQVLDECLGLWRGEALVDVAGEFFAQGHLTRLNERRREAQERRVDILLELGRHRELSGELNQLVADSPLRERLHEQLILALYRSGRQADALRAYDRARTVLVDELGIDPSPRLRQLELAVLAQDPSLDWVEPSVAPLGPPADPPARSHVGRLPIPISPIIGRKAEVNRGLELLKRNRLLTFTGPGGAGKTRLAIEVSNQCMAKNVWFVDLGSITLDDRVGACVAEVLGLPSISGGDTMRLIVQSLARRRGLLVLDTCEHVLRGAAELTVDILQNCPNIRVLTTSRRPLGITAEIAWPVSPLSLPPPEILEPIRLLSYPSVQLFAERAKAVRPSFDVQEANAADVAAICLSLDGLPLAIELAAARCDVLTAAAIRTRLENRFNLLVGEAHGPTVRQHTLRSAIDWSFQLLNEKEQRYFSRLAVFPSSFDLDAAVAVADDHPDPLQLLSTLVRSSMVVLDNDDRYRLLDSMRAYASDQLPAGSSNCAIVHAKHYAELAEAAAIQIVGSDQILWLARLRAEMPNFRTALRWAFATGQDELAARLVTALGWFWILEGMLDEAENYFDRVNHLDSVPEVLRTEVLWQHALLSNSLGRLDAALQKAQESVSRARRSNDQVSLCHGLNAVAVVQWSLGDLVFAAQSHDEAIGLLTGSDQYWILGVCLALRARTAFDAGEATGLTFAKDGLLMAQASGDRHVIGLALEQIAVYELSQDNPAVAVVAARLCLDAHETIGYSEGTIAALHVLARTLTFSGDLTSAAAHHRRSLALAVRIGHVAAICEALEGLAVIAVLNNSFDQALRLLDVAGQKRVKHGVPLRAPDVPVDQNMRSQVEAACSKEYGPTTPLADGEINSLVAELITGENQRQLIRTGPGPSADTNNSH